VVHDSLGRLRVITGLSGLQMGVNFLLNACLGLAKWVVFRVTNIIVDKRLTVFLKYSGCIVAIVEFEILRNLI
jgi:hypothetical protein